MRAALAILAIFLGGAAARPAAAQDESPPTDSVPAPPCLVPDSAALDSVVRVATARTRPRVITPKLITIERAQRPDYRGLTDAAWQAVDMSDGITGRRAVVLVAAVRSDPATRVRQLLVRVPANTLLPSHWHSGDETQLVVRGAVRVRDAAGQEATLGPGGFSFLPARLPHGLSTGPEEVLLLVTTTGEWDIHLPGEPRRLEPGEGSVGRGR